MKYFKGLGCYRNSTKTNWYDPNNEIAISSDHWIYLKRIDGKLIFNHTFYSA